MAHRKRTVLGGIRKSYHIRQPLCERWSLHGVQLHLGGGTSRSRLKVEVLKIRSLAQMRILAGRSAHRAPLTTSQGNTRYIIMAPAPIRFIATSGSEHLMKLQIKCSEKKCVLVRSTVSYSAVWTHMSTIRRDSKTTRLESGYAFPQWAVKSVVSGFDRQLWLADKIKESMFGGRIFTVFVKHML